jgi:hypothetical protein
MTDGNAAGPLPPGERNLADVPNITFIGHQGGKNAVNGRQVDVGGMTIETPVPTMQDVGRIMNGPYSARTKVNMAGRINDMPADQIPHAKAIAQAAGIPTGRAAGDARQLLQNEQYLRANGGVDPSLSTLLEHNGFTNSALYHSNGVSNAGTQAAADAKARITADGLPGYNQLMSGGSEAQRVAAASLLGGLKFLPNVGANDIMSAYRSAMQSGDPAVQRAAAEQIAWLPSALKPQAYEMAMGTRIPDVERAAAANLWNYPESMYPQVYDDGVRLGLWSNLQVWPIFNVANQPPAAAG